jgi:ribosome recycling factor
MSSEEILLDVEERMEKALSVLKHGLQGIRTGRANPGLVDSIRVDVYGSQTPIKGLASISCPEPTQIVVRAFDPTTLKDIEKAIQASGLGFNPQNDGKLLRINIPPLSTETRRKLGGRLKELAEECKVAIRNVRRDGNKAADQEQKDKILTEDDRDQVKEEIQTLTKKFEDQADSLASKKEKEVMED